MSGKNKTRSEWMKRKKKGEKKGGGFVYVEDVNRLQNQINGLRFQMNVLKHLLVGLGKLHNQAVDLRQKRWSIFKTCVVLLVLLTIALMSEQSWRKVAIQNIQNDHMLLAKAHNSSCNSSTPTQVHSESDMSVHAKVHNESGKIRGKAQNDPDKFSTELTIADIIEFLDFLPENVILELCFGAVMPYLVYIFLGYITDKVREKDFTGIVYVQRDSKGYFHLVLDNMVISNGEFTTMRHHGNNNNGVPTTTTETHICNDCSTRMGESLEDKLKALEEDSDLSPGAATTAAYNDDADDGLQGVAAGCGLQGVDEAGAGLKGVDVVDVGCYSGMYGSGGVRVIEPDEDDGEDKGEGAGGEVGGSGSSTSCESYQHVDDAECVD